MFLYINLFFSHNVLFLLYGFFPSFISDHSLKMLKSCSDCSLLENLGLFIHTFISCINFLRVTCFLSNLILLDILLRIFFLIRDNLIGKFHIRSPWVFSILSQFHNTLGFSFSSFLWLDFLLVSENLEFFLFIFEVYSILMFLLVVYFIQHFCVWKNCVGVSPSFKWILPNPPSELSEPYNHPCTHRTFLCL